MKFAAIPTVYAGVQFRSRLEARWAAFFDLLKVKWDYEPIDCAGYIPDFIVTRFLSWASPNVLFEVKPGRTANELFTEAAPAMDACRWDGAVCVGGVGPDVMIKRERPDLEWVSRGAPLDGDDSRRLERKAWLAAGNLVQWKTPRK